MSITHTQAVESLSLTKAARARLDPKRAVRRAGLDKDKLKRRIAAALHRGDNPTARNLQGVLLRSFGGKLASLNQANRKVKLTARLRARALVEEAINLDIGAEQSEEVIIFAKRKGANDFRAIHEFGLCNRARQILLAEALKPFVRIDAARQFALRGGRDAAVEAVKRHIAEGAKFACEIDISSFYPSINRDWVAANSPMQTEIIRAVAIPDDYPSTTYRGCGIYPIWRPASSISLNAKAARGLPQGSACSPIFAEFILAQIISTLPASLRVVNFGHNLLVMGRTGQELDQSLQDCSGAISRHPAGPFTLRYGDRRQTAWGFDFLGYHFESYQGRAFVRASKQAQYAAFGRIKIELGAISRGDKDAVRRLHRFCRGWAAAFGKWGKASSVLSGVLFWGCLRWFGELAKHRITEIMRCAPC